MGGSGVGWIPPEQGKDVGLLLAFEDTPQQEVLPTFRRGRARVLETSLDEQLRGVGSEAGVREQL